MIFYTVKISKTRTFIYFFTIGFISLSCNPPSKTTKPLVLVSVAPYSQFIERLTSNEVNVKTVVPPGVNVHHFELKPSQIQDIVQASIWFQVGEPFETSLDKSSLSSCKKIDLRIYTPNFTGDRHVWMSPKLVQHQINIIANEISLQCPHLTPLIEQNKEILIDELQALDEEIRSALQNKQGKTLLVSHPAFGYFCHEYALEQLSLEQGDHECCGPRHLKTIWDQSKALQPCVAIEMPQHSSKGVRQISHQLTIPLCSVDPYEGDYFAMMRELTQQVASSL